MVVAAEYVEPARARDQAVAVAGRGRLARSEPRAEVGPRPGADVVLVQVVEVVWTAVRGPAVGWGFGKRCGRWGDAGMELWLSKMAGN